MMLMQQLTTCFGSFLCFYVFIFDIIFFIFKKFLSIIFLLSGGC